MKTLEYNSKRLAKRIQALMKESSNVIVSPNTSKNVPKMQEIDEQEAYKQEVHKHPVLLTRQVIDFLKVRYDFRYNLLTEETEFRPSGQREIPFCRLDKRELNTFCLEAHKEGINCWDKDLQRYIYSTLVESYHPFRLYMCISVVFFTLFFMIASDKANQALQAVSSLNINDGIVAQLKSSATLPDTCVYVYQGPELVKAFQERGVEKAEELFKVQQLDDRFSLSYVRMPRIVADSCLHETTLRQKDLNTILNLKKVKGEYLDDFVEEEEITSESLQAARHFQVDSTGTALTPVYEWKEDHSDEAQQLRQESFLNQFFGDLSKWTPLYMMFLLPLFAWLLQGMFRKAKFPYMWHFVHAIHLNTVFLILIPIPLVPVLTSDTFMESFKGNMPMYTLLIFVTGMFVYTYISLHTVYRRGWIRTFVKTTVFLAVFTFISLAIAAALLVFLLSTLSEQL